MKPVREFLLIPFGRVRTERAGISGFELTRENAQTLAAGFAARGVKLVIDYHHQSVRELNTRPDGLAPAAGWIGGLEVRRDGLWATNVEWTDKARAALAAGEYRYFSPVLFWADKERRQIRALGPVALTNDPAMNGVASLAAEAERGALADALQARDLLGANDPMKGDAMNRIAQALGLSPDASEEEVLAAIRKLRDGGGGGGGSGGGGASGTGGAGKEGSGGLGLQALAAKLELDDVSDEAGLIAAINAKIAKAGRTDPAILERLTKLEGDNATLRKRNADAEYDALCASGAGKGKITPAMKEAWRGIFHSDRAAFDKMLAAQPVIAGDRSVFNAEPVRCADDREKTILTARTQFAEELAGNKIVLSGELDYVNLALRDAKLELLTAEEIRKHSIKV